ncbi:unnamed protein product, partial [marine sediment metagenome]
NGSLTWETHYLKPDYFLALFYDDTKEKTPDPTPSEDSKTVRRGYSNTTGDTVG